jgi:hypothetical protein
MKSKSMAHHQQSRMCLRGGLELPDPIVAASLLPVAFGANVVSRAPLES